jgi:hypothetical protein
LKYGFFRASFSPRTPSRPKDLRQLGQDIMGKEEQVRKVWEIAKGYVAGQRRVYHSALSNLAPHFGAEMLNDIAALRNAKGSELESAVEEVRGKLNIAQAMGMFSQDDLERINVELDKIS